MVLVPVFVCLFVSLAVWECLICVFFYLCPPFVLLAGGTAAFLPPHGQSYKIRHLTQRGKCYFYILAMGWQIPDPGRILLLLYFLPSAGSAVRARVCARPDQGCHVLGFWRTG